MAEPAAARTGAAGSAGAPSSGAVPAEGADAEPAAAAAVAADARAVSVSEAEPAGSTAGPGPAAAGVTPATSTTIDLEAVRALLDPQPHAPRPVTHRGVTLGFLRQLVAGLGPGTTVAQAVEGAVRPATSATRCCLFDLVPRRCTSHGSTGGAGSTGGSAGSTGSTEAAAGPPQYFISHTWSRPLGELLSLLDTRFGGEGPDRGAHVTVWLDILAVSERG